MDKTNACGYRPALPVFTLLVVALSSPVHAQSAAPASAENTMTLAQALERAATQNPDLVMARTAVRAAEHKVASARARRYPSVSFEANVIRWNEALTFQIELPGVPPDPNAPAATIRDQYTATFTGRVVQPLSGLLVVSSLIDTERAGLEAASADVEVAQLDVISHAATVYFAALQTRALRDIARQSITQLDAQQTQARALASVGALDQVDVMRLDAARAAAEQELAAMEAAVRDADEGLFLILGMPLDSTVEPVDNFPETLPPVAVAEAEAVDAAQGRPTLRAADARAMQAKGGRDLAKANMLPSVNAVLQADRNEGQGTFARKNQWFVGVTLSWNAWDWGASWSEVKAAGAQAEGARLAADRARDRIALEVRAAVRKARAAYHKLDAANRGAAAAEEAYRIQSVRYQEGALTTTDLLTAQVDVTRARGSLALARFEYLSATAALHRAMGQTPTLSPLATPLPRPTTTAPEGSK